MNYTFKWTVVQNITDVAARINASLDRVTGAGARLSTTMAAVTPPVIAIAEGLTGVTAAATAATTAATGTAATITGGMAAATTSVAATGSRVDAVTRAAGRLGRAVRPVIRSVASLEERAEDLDGAFNRATSVARMTRLAGAIRRNNTQLGMMQLRARLVNGELYRMGGMGGRLTSMFGGALALAGGYGLGQLISGAVTAQAEYGKLEAVLKNAFGGNREYARDYLAIVERFATNTPFKMEEVTKATTKMVMRGFVPAYDQLVKLGDIAAATGGGFEQFIEAVLDGQMGQFDRFNEFSIKASSQADKVTIAFKNASMTVKKDSTSIMDAILKLGDQQGVTGSMDAIMGTMAGKLSNFEDQIYFLKRSFGAALEPIIQQYLPQVIDKLAEWSAWVQGNGPAISAWIEGVVERAANLWGTFVTVAKWAGLALGSMMAFSAISSVVGTLVALWRGATFAIAAYRAGVVTATGVQAFFNEVVAANPVGLITIGIMAAVAAIWYLTTQFDSFGEFLTAFGQFFLDYSPFGWLFKVIDYYFPEAKTAVGELFQGLMDWGLKAWNWLHDKLFGPIGTAFGKIGEWLQKVGIISIGVETDNIGVGIRKNASPTEGVDADAKENALVRMLNANYGTGTGTGKASGGTTGAGGAISAQSGDLTARAPASTSLSISISSSSAWSSTRQTSVSRARRCARR